MSEEILNENAEAVESTGSESSEMSKSKAKREARKAEAQSDKNKKSFDSILGIVIGIIIAAVVIGTIIMGIISSANTIESSNTFSACLNEDGTITGAKLDKVADIGLDSLVIPLADVTYADSQVEDQVQNLLSNNQKDSTDPSLTVEMNKTINLDYVGYIDGVAFDGGNTNGAGATLTIGSGTYIDDFEEQLIGSHPGDSVTVNVTFPDPYDSNPDLSGKEAVFECVINSMKVRPELTDEFVAETCSGFATTVDELYEYYRNSGYENNVTTYITNYISENASAKSVPSAYVKNIQSTTKFADEQTYNYYSQMYTYYYGYNPYPTFEDYSGKTAEEYDDYLRDFSKKQAVEDLTYEAYFKSHNLTVSDEDYNFVLEALGGESASENYGLPYIRQYSIKYCVIDYLTKNANVQ